MKVTSERIRNIIPAAIARLAIHVQTSSASFSTSLRSSGAMSTGLMFFSTSFGLAFFLVLRAASSPFSKYTNPIVDLKYSLSKTVDGATNSTISIANPQQVLPLPQVAFEAKTLGNLET